MPHYSTFTLLDYSDEKSTVSVHNGAITAVSIAGFLTQLGALRDAIDGITLGTLQKEKWVGDDTVVTNAWPTDPAAQREAKLLVTYMDTTTEKEYTLTVPTVDFSVLISCPVVVTRCCSRVRVRLPR